MASDNNDQERFIAVMHEGEAIGTIRVFVDKRKICYEFINPFGVGPELLFPATNFNPRAKNNRANLKKALLTTFDELTDAEAEELVNKAAIKASELKPGKQKSNGDTDREGVAQKLIRLAQERCSFFRDEHNTGFAAVKIGEGESIAVYPVKSRDFKNLLHKWLWESEGKAANSEATKSAINTLEAIACFEGERHTLSLRVTWREDRILYDPGREDWKLIEIDKEGWRWVEHTTPIFRRYKHMQAQLEPDEEATPEDFKKLLDHVRIGNGDGLIYLCNIASFLIPDIPHPVPVIYGAQGSGKTTACEMTRAVVDPSSLGALSFPHDNKELIQTLAHNYVALFDNVDKLSQTQSDILCRAVTGAAQSKRELYTDDEDFYYKYIRCVGTNGINISGTKPDFQDRAIIYELERIPVTERKPIKEVKAAFQEDLPAIVGGLFATISRAMAMVEEVRKELTTLPRMADFTIWAESIARSISYPPLNFFEAYMDKIRKQNKEVIEGNIIGDLVLKLLEGREIWQGTPTELLGEITTLAEENKVDTKAKGFPKAPNSITRKLNELRTNLADEGILIERDRESTVKRKRIIRIYRKIESGKIPSEPSNRPIGPGKTLDDMLDDIAEGENTVHDTVQTETVPETGRLDNMDDVSRGFSNGICFEEAQAYLEAFNIAKFGLLNEHAWWTHADSWEHAVKTACRGITATRRVEIEESLNIREIGTRVEIPTASVELLKQIAAGGGGDGD